MSLEVVTLIVLFIMFIVGSVISINIGVLGLVAALVVGFFFSELSVDEINAAFPVGMFILLTGVTYLFAIAQNNGTLDLIVTWGLRMVRGNIGLLPWVMFVLSALLGTVGAATLAIGPILFPIALRLAFQYEISPVLMGIMVSTGMYAGSFSPLNIFGLIINGIMQSENLSHSPVLLFVNCLIFYVLISLVLFFIFGGLRLLKSQTNVQVQATATADADFGNTDELQEGLTLYKAVTLMGIGLLIVLALGFSVDMGYGALMIGLALSLMAPKKQTKVLRQVPWAVILMVTGIMTYVGVMEQVGTLDYLTELIASVGDPILAALVASCIGGVVSSFASTTGFLAAVIPLAAPILENSTISSLGVVSSLAVASSIVDISPFSTNGALILANVQGVNERVFFRKLLFTAGAFVALGPGLAWLMFTVIGMPW